MEVREEQKELARLANNYVFFAYIEKDSGLAFSMATQAFGLMQGQYKINFACSLWRKHLKAQKLALGV